MPVKYLRETTCVCKTKPLNKKLKVCNLLLQTHTPVRTKYPQGPDTQVVYMLVSRDFLLGTA